jgi:sugar/nucleoside kinase (ribokinase family)
VERHRRELLDLLHGDVDLLFCNEEEALLLFSSPDLDHAVASIEETGLLAAVTRGAEGCVVVMADRTVKVPAEAVEKVVDTTGAGDMFAAGFLYGLTHGLDPVSCARLGGACAAEVISHLGARPQSDISELVPTAGQGP